MERLPARWAWLDLLPVAWLAFVLVTYAFLSLYPLEAPPRTRVPEVVALDPYALPLLLSLLVAAIIRYFCLRPGSPAVQTADPSRAPDEGRDTP